MSGQWEVVNRAKKKQNGQPQKKLSKSEKQMVIENAPKVEDVLPLSQVQTLYETLGKGNKENKKPGKENVVKNTSKNQQKKLPQAQGKKKDSGKEKPGTPKTLEAALRLINLKELLSEISMGQARFPDAPIVWLKGLVVYLNTKLTVENVHPVFAGKPHDYPKSQLPGELRDLLNRIVKEMDVGVAQALFEWCLTAMANDMSRGGKAFGTVLGYKILVQLIAMHKPAVAIAAVPKVNELQESYQNQQPIGQSLLWAVGQGGYQDLGAGLKVWQKAMLPMQDLRLYTSFVMSYLESLLTASPKVARLSSEQLMPTLRLLCSPSANAPTARRKEMQELVPKLLGCVRQLPHKGALVPLFPDLMQLLGEVTGKTSWLQNELLMTLATAVLEDELGGAAWLEVYSSHFSQSKLLLDHLVSSWPKMSKQGQVNFKKTLKAIQAANSALEKKGCSDPSFRQCQQLCADLQGRMTTARRGFPWRAANLFLLAAIAALVVFDVRRHGTFRASSTGRFLRDLGALPYVEGAAARTKTTAVRSYRWLEANAPEYYQNAWEVSRPYVVSAKDLAVAGAKQVIAGCHVAYEYVCEKSPLVGQKIEEWAPGLQQRCAELGVQLWEQVKIYSVAGGKAVSEYSQNAATWARTNVFVGSWSPDNLQQYSLAVLNATQHYALGTYDWLYQKVQTLSKVP